MAWRYLIFLIVLGVQAADARCGSALKNLPREESCPPNHLCVKMTGYLPDPADNQPDNPTEHVGKCFDKVVFDGIHVSVEVLKVTKEAVDAYVDQLTGTEPLLIHIGLGPGSKIIDVEPEAKNRYQFKGPAEAIDRALPQSHTLTVGLDAKQLARKLSSEGYQVRSEPGAGTYVCNYMGYQSLRKSATRKNVMFFHVPYEQDLAISRQVSAFKSALVHVKSMISSPSSGDGSPDAPAVETVPAQEASSPPLSPPILVAIGLGATVLIIGVIASIHHVCARGQGSQPPQGGGEIAPLGGQTPIKLRMKTGAEGTDATAVGQKGARYISKGAGKGSTRYGDQQRKNLRSPRRRV